MIYWYLYNLSEVRWKKRYILEEIFPRASSRIAPALLHHDQNSAGVSYLWVGLLRGYA